MGLSLGELRLQGWGRLETPAFQVCIHFYSGDLRQALGNVPWMLVGYVLTISEDQIRGIYI